MNILDNQKYAAIFTLYQFHLPLVMGNNNIHLQSAKNARDDEFYTTYETIEKEVSHYTAHFRGKTVLCNCDDPYESNFCRFFLKNFNVLGLARLICTSFQTSRVIATELPLFDDEDKPLVQGQGYVLDIERFSEEEARFSDAYVASLLQQTRRISKLKGNGDFRSKECLKYLKEADIVVTNPPFSLFKELIALLVKHKKKYLLIGNQNALTYKEIFPLIQSNEAWTGYQFGDMKFRVPENSEPRKTRFWIDHRGQKWRSLGNAMWLTNLDIERRHSQLKLTKRYTPEEYPTYDHYNAINVRRVCDIPMDYAGIMGVPITIINKYNPEQFELIGEANHGSDNEYDLFKPTINGKQLFKRILIRNRQPMMKRVEKFKILDLFCGAGGFSYGMEKNPHFETVVASDNDTYVGATFRHNMPDCKVIIGDITETPVKSEIIAESKSRGVNMIIGGPPCQGFSNKGKKLGLSDPRNFLFREYLSLVKELQPEVFVIENVKTLLSASNCWFRNEIIKEIHGLGYHVKFGVLNSADYAVPQARERAIFICCKDRAIDLPSPTTSIQTTVRDAISDLAYLESGEGAFEQAYTTAAASAYQKMMREGARALFNHRASKHKQVAIEKLKMIPAEKGKECLPQELHGNQKFKTTWGRLKWDDVSPTIDTRFDAASNGTNNHPFLHRSITPREAARLQSFDDRFIFLGSKVRVRKQIGNAVPPLMAKAIADKIYKEKGVKNEL